jgi:DNA-binding HxlR family transcriptional regulator
MRKESSTNNINEKRLRELCGTSYALSIIGGRWKPTIICRLMDGKVRYSDLRDSIIGISERNLVQQNRAQEKQWIQIRIVHPQVPPKVEYELTEDGLCMQPMLSKMSEWGNNHKAKYQKEELV